MEVRIKTNLDLQPHEKWPTSLPTVPRVGDYITSAHKWPGGVRLTLQVYSVTWEPTMEYSGSEIRWTPYIELNLMKFHGSINEFHKWYRGIQGQNY